MADADRHLLLGVLAMQNELIRRDQLVAAFHDWTRDKSRSLADCLVTLGHLSATQRSVVEALTDLHIEAHHGKVELSLAAGPARKSTRECLAILGDPDIDTTLAQFAFDHGSTEDSDAECTASYAVGTATSVVGTATSSGQRFRVLRPHATGGLGAVFVAIDAELNREVALKQIIDAHADDPTSRRRFLIEAEITGGLEHPGIVPVYGLGTYADGRPYYAMRFIRGDSLKEAISSFHADGSLNADASRRSLELRKLLRRFTDVCNAIEYAHARGVLHRDIKPGNVIVGKHGETLVVDWGLAKARTRSEEAATGEATLVTSSSSGSAETLPGQVLGTPAYMSPEQARGELEAIGPRSDVYSLGATLYCLLTGRAPFANNDLGALLWTVQRGEFPPPRQLDPAIDRPLEAICLKAMATDPEGRYASAQALADDVERWMADEPTEAWPEPWTRSAARWLGRHRTGLTAAAVAAVVALTGLGAVAAVQTRGRLTLEAKNLELRAANIRAERRYELAADAIRTFHTGVSEDFLLKERQFKELHDLLLKSASGFYERLGHLLDQETDFGSRRALAAANFELAKLTAKVGRVEDALAAHRAALAAREALASGAGADGGLTFEVGLSLTEVGRLLAATGQADEALTTYRRAEAQLSGPAGSDPSALAALAACRMYMGDLLARTGKRAEGLAAYRRARSDQEAPAAASGAPGPARSDLADSRYRIAHLLTEMGRLAEAETEHRAALAMRHALAEADPAVAGFRSREADSHDALALLLARTGRPAEAETEHRAALAIRHALADAYPAVTTFPGSLATSHDNLGVLLAWMGRPAEAETEYRAALAILRQLAEAHPAVTDFRLDQASGHNNLGVLLAEAGRPADAETEYRAALAVYQALADANPAVADFRSRLAGTHNNLGNLLEEAGRSAEAEVEFRSSLAIRRALAAAEPAVPEFRSRLANAHNNLGLLLTDAGRSAEAEAEFRAALSLLRPLVESQPAVTDFRFFLANTHVGLGDLLSKTGRPTDAEAEHLAALALRRVLADANPAVAGYQRELAESVSKVGTLRAHEGPALEAADSFRRAIEILERLPTPTTGDFYNLARFRSLLAEAVAGPDPGVSADEGRAEANRAMAALRRAVAAGYRDLKHMRVDTDLDPLRGREDFHLLMMDLAMPAEPFVRTR
jgi:serine/threonine-protein kinase